jgi:hypothetical protein
LPFSETFDFWAIFYVGYGVYLAVASVVAIFWIVYARRSRRNALATSTGLVSNLMQMQFRLVFSLIRLGRSSVALPAEIPGYKQILTIAGTTGLAVATLSGFVVVFLQWLESVA